jgi:adenine/guanine phosphoribosyltransferase-like PRPP-binding protein
MTNFESYRHGSNNSIIQGSDHTCKVLNHKNRNKIIIKAVCELRKIQNTFDSIACCGISGLMVAPQIAEILDKNIVVVRKKDDKSYSSFIVEGASPYLYIVIDDLICSGNTLKWIKNNIYEENPKAKCVGLYCYLPEDSAYTTKTSKEFYNRYRLHYLNPCEPRPTEFWPTAECRKAAERR